MLGRNGIVRITAYDPIEKAEQYLMFQMWTEYDAEANGMIRVNNWSEAIAVVDRLAGK